MKKLLICLATLSIIACKKEAPKDYATFSGKIENKNSDSLVVYQGRTFNKTIKVNEDGTFSDTLKVNPGLYGVYDGKSQTYVFLENDMDVKMTIDAKDFKESASFSGKGAEKSNFLIEKNKFEDKLVDIEALKSLDSAGLESKIEDIKKQMLAFYDKNKAVDSTIIANSIKQVEPNLNGLKSYVLGSIKLKEQFPVGSPSPTFENYENFKGGTTSLSDLKGKYVYIDVWATWCGPCIGEIPALQALEKDYEGKNIAFVSISTDNGRGYRANSKEESFALAKEGWRKMIEDKEMSGIQLFSDKAFESDFVTGYKINSIPRFILIDPNGNIADADAPRPSYPNIKAYFDAYGI
ncbi:TlpA family protein disulfide reductase [Olleya aquimaris]|uniref:AhpC/TSA family protein n=1 Tax=Olleya aquimaris TaxID=639310 RepID=A0A327RJ23_9FLAO|nr:TlpA disulfide reductase family protein [Olleya aquimaris]RAJ16218.1 AhpC/TSA family protein [Olleya aquimaris]